MINPESINPFELPSVPVDCCRNLPPVAGIYFAINKLEQLQYIGKSVNIQNRWIRHARRHQLNDCRIAWIECEKNSLNKIERDLIYRLKPTLNGSYIQHVHQVGLRNRFKDFLIKEGISVREFSLNTGVHHTVCHLMKRDPYYVPDEYVLEKICSRYKIEPSEIVYRVDAPQCDQSKKAKSNPDKSSISEIKREIAELSGLASIVLDRLKSLEKTLSVDLEVRFDDGEDSDQ